MSTLTVKTSFHVRRRSQGRKQMESGDAPPDVGHGVPRISRLMALAIRFDQLVRDGIAADYAELARLGHVTRARMTQVINLLNLAPDIQEELLFLECGPGRERICERTMRPVAAEVDWRKQRRMWHDFHGTEHRQGLR